MQLTPKDHIGNGGWAEPLNQTQQIWAANDRYVIRYRFHLFPASHNVRSILKADIRFQSIICRERP